MASRYSKAKGRGGTKSFVMLRYDIIESDAWLSLNTNARCVWTEIMHRYNGLNNGSIPLSCREAADLCGISKDTAARAFKDLQEKGFIKIGLYAGFKNKGRMATEWIVTHENVGTQSPTNEWKKYTKKQKTVSPQGHTVSPQGRKCLILE